MFQTRARSRRKYNRFLMDALETRTLMSVNPVVNTIPGLQALNGVYDNDGHLWVFGNDNVGNSLFEQVDPVHGTILDSINLSSFGANPNGSSFVVGKGAFAGHIYAPDAFGPGIDDINLGDHTAQLTQIGATSDTPLVMTGAPDGALWYLNS